MSYGYSQSLVAANKKANAKSLGVALGRLCIKHGIPVTEVAKELEVSRMAVYNWFLGTHSPTSSLKSRVLAYVDSLKKRN
jgi:hypothetical protein